MRSKSARAHERVFVVDGPRAISVALESEDEKGQSCLHEVYVSTEASRAATIARTLEMAGTAGCRVFQLTADALEYVGASASSQGIIGTAGFVDAPLALLRDAERVLVCVGVRDPGNLGTILRSAVAAGWGGVICCGGCADVYNPKAVRASAGAIFRAGLAVEQEAGSVLRECRSWGMRRIGTDPSKGFDCATMDWTVPFALVLGNESAGLSKEIFDLVDVTVTVPMAQGLESLNVSMAATVLCFEATRSLRGTRISCDASHRESQDAMS